MPVYCYTLNADKQVIKKWVARYRSLNIYNRNLLDLHHAICYEYPSFENNLEVRTEILTFTNYTKEEVLMNYMLGVIHNVDK